MTTPGSNILNRAFRLIKTQTVQYYRFLSRVEQINGQDLATYATPIYLKASVQPVSRNLIQFYGLDFQRHYVNVYIARQTLDIDRDVSGDQLSFRDARYQILSRTAWAQIDGWDALLCVQVENVG